MGKVVTIEWVDGDDKPKRRFHNEPAFAQRHFGRTELEKSQPSKPALVPRSSIVDDYQVAIDEHQMVINLISKAMKGDAVGDAAYEQLAAYFNKYRIYNADEVASYTDGYGKSHICRHDFKSKHNRSGMEYLLHEEIQAKNELIKLQAKAQRKDYKRTAIFGEKQREEEIRQVLHENRVRVTQAASRWGVTLETYEQIVLKSLDAKFSAELDLRKMQIELEQAQRKVELNFQSDRYRTKLDIEKAQALANIEVEKSRQLSDIDLRRKETLEANEYNREIKLHLLASIYEASRRYYDLKSYGASKKEIKMAKLYLDSLEERWERLSSD